MTTFNRFDSVLIANRGEIAVRVIRACRAAGLRTVAVYSDADPDAPHVRAADSAVRIGPPPASESYLSIPALLDAARASGAGAIHPGYGFLSERASFARAVTDAGLVFIGPTADVMDAMGRKDRAREIAIAANVSVVPSSGEQDLSRAAAEVGFPLLAKAAAGGGGKGMRIVRSPDELEDALAAARREAQAAFGDDTMLIERFVEGGRHIEVQIIADEHGNVLHLHERDCSVQRRHQKVVEEAPAVAISAEVRAVVLDSAVALAREVDYTNAGTVEFLVAGEDAYFLEMNTRLQVEHPVTEAVTGLDLVDLQLVVAQGLPLPITQSDVRVSGHAIEVRVYAEDARHGFLPQAGLATRVDWPRGARVDEALQSGQRVSTYYDPMLAKIITSAPTREGARQQMIEALDESAVVGLTTNLGFLRALVGSNPFADSTIDTAWLDRHDVADVMSAAVDDAPWILAAWAASRGNTRSGDSADPLRVADGWRLGGPPAPTPVSLRAADADAAEARVFLVDRAAHTVTGDGARDVHERTTSADGWSTLEIDGVAVTGLAIVDAHAVTVVCRGETVVFELPDPFGSSRHQLGADGTISAPMPGTVLSVAVTEGARVAAGDLLGVLEAMKMELALRAPYDGVVTAVSAQAGRTAALGDNLFVVEALTESSG